MRAALATGVAFGLGVPGTLAVQTVMSTWTEWHTSAAMILVGAVAVVVAGAFGLVVGNGVVHRMARDIATEQRPMPPATSGADEQRRQFDAMGSALRLARDVQAAGPAPRVEIYEGLDG